MSILPRILVRHFSKGQTISYVLACFLGLSIILCAIQLHSDMAPALSEKGTPGDMSYFNGDYVVITKKLSSLSTFGVGETRFSPEDIQEIKAQPWAKDVGNFQAAEFSVYAAVNIGGADLSTILFLESVPDDFIDDCPPDWDFDSTKLGKEEIPVIIPRDYLALYNFGLAPSRGLPQLSDEIVKSVPISLILVGNGRRIALPAKIAGFSNRLNTIAAPEKFVTWANRCFSSDSDVIDNGGLSAPSRLVIVTDKPGDPALKDFLKSHFYEAAGNNVETGKASFFLSVFVAIVAGIGVVISLLAVIILLLSIFLLIQQNRAKIHHLMELGYSPRMIAKYYFMIIAALNSAVFLLAAAALFAASSWWRSMLLSLDIYPASLWSSLILGFVIMIVVTYINFMVVNRMIKKCFR